MCRTEEHDDKGFFGTLPVVGRLSGKNVKKKSTSNFKQRYMFNSVALKFINSKKSWFQNNSTFVLLKVRIMCK